MTAPVGDLHTVLVASGPSFTRVNTLLSIADIPLSLQGEITTITIITTTITYTNTNNNDNVITTNTLPVVNKLPI